MSWMRSRWWQIKRTRCASLAVTREHINDAAKTIKNTREPIENVVRMTTLQNVRAKQELMMIQSCKSKTKNEDENQASLSCEMKHETTFQGTMMIVAFYHFGPLTKKKKTLNNACSSKQTLIKRPIKWYYILELIFDCFRTMVINLKNCLHTQHGFSAVSNTRSTLVLSLLLIHSPNNQTFKCQQLVYNILKLC